MQLAIERVGYAMCALPVLRGFARDGEGLIDFEHLLAMGCS